MNDPIDAICIDDSKDFRSKHTGILKLLAGMGHLGEVVEARTVEEACDLLEGPYSGLRIGTGIIDYHLGNDPKTGKPYHTGLDFMTAMFVANPQASFVLATAHSDIKALGEHAARIGGYAVPKTIRPMELAEHVQKAIDNYHAHPERVELRRASFDQRHGSQLGGRVGNFEQDRDTGLYLPSNN
ncbi:hypothetical protein HYT52_04815 [Candidatus Woesearchaeota archaeon]|nr:hypothetical protein [Candidatus Woesearchaeota archaeon]